MRWKIKIYFSLHLEFRTEMENMKIGLEFCFLLCIQGGREFCLYEKEGYQFCSRE